MRDYEEFITYILAASKSKETDFDTLAFIDSGVSKEQIRKFQKASRDIRLSVWRLINAGDVFYNHNGLLELTVQGKEKRKK